MTKRKITFLWWVLALVFLFSAMGCQTNAPSGTGGAVSKRGQAGTTLSASKTATGFWEKVITYDWSIQKDATLSQNGTSVIYTLTATRTKASEDDRYGVRGTITVTNGGERNTQGLSITDIVKYKVGSGKFQTLTTAPVDTLGAEILAGETKSFDYEVAFTPVPGAQYKNTAKVTILNHSGWLGKPFGPGAKEEQGPSADFSLPSTPTIKYVDQTADIEDELTCPDGFTCTVVDGPEYPLEWKNIGAGNTDDSYTWTITYTMTPNQGNTICESVRLGNVVTLIESDSGQTRTASAGLSWGCAILEKCYQGETAWAKGSKYNPDGSGQWAMYVEYGGSEKTVDLIAGKFYDVGDVTFSNPVNGYVTITITLSGARFKNVSENVKIRGYSDPPLGNPRFDEFGKYTVPVGQNSFSIDVPQNNYYGVHVDVEREVPCE